MDMDTKPTQKNRFLKLSLKKSRVKQAQQSNKHNRSSDVIILDESYERLKPDFQKTVQSHPKMYSPIVINDSCEFDNELPKITLRTKEPSKAGNISFNCSREDASPSKASCPDIGGWSPAQNIICATPRHEPTPSSPKDIANESQEQCSIKKIHLSQKKLLNDLYGETWKSIPKLFKAIKANYENYNTVSKKLRFDDEESDKENIRLDIKRNKMLYLTDSEAKRRVDIANETEKRSKKKLYTEKVPSTPDVPKTKLRNVYSTTKKDKVKKAMSVTEMVEVMKNDVEILAKKVESVSVTPRVENVNRISFIGSLAVHTVQFYHVMGVKPSPLCDRCQSPEDFRRILMECDHYHDLRMKIMPDIVLFNGELNIHLRHPMSQEYNVPSWRCHVEAIRYRDGYKTLKEELTRRLYVEFNKGVFDNALEADMPILWDTKLRTTAGTTTNRLVKNSKGDRIRTSSIKLSTKVLDGPQRLRDTLIHELCHAATWLIDSELRAGHGPLWTKWAKRALRVFPELGEISRCHDMEIHFKYTYKCTKCGYSVQRHSKSIDVTKKCCGYCRGTFELTLNKKNKDGVVVSTPARKGTTNDFALYVKENYAALKDGTRNHAQVMKILGEQFAKNKAT